MEEADSAALEQNIEWSQLNQDLVHLISKKILDLSDFVKFRAVCKRWRSAVPRSDPTPRFPWILQHRCSLQDDFHFYSLPYSKTCTFEISDKMVHTAVSRSSPAKYFLSLSRFQEDWISWSIAPLNPPSRSLIPLPPPRNWSRLDMMKPYNRYSAEANGEYGFIFKNILYENKNNYGLCLSDEWIFNEEHYQGDGNAYHKGMYFYDSACDGTMVIDVYSGEVISEIPPQERANVSPCFHCLVETSTGELLKVYRPYDIELHFEEIFFEVYRLCMDEEEQPFWIEVKNVGDEMLFLDYSATGLALNAGDFAGCEGNCIYFLKGEILNHAKYPPSFILCRYNLTDGKIEKLPYASEKWGTWVIPFLG